MELRNNNHSVFSIHFHLILVIKYRKKVIDERISERLKEIFEYIQDNYNITLKEWNHDIDYIHILFRSEPNTNVSKFINTYKSASSRLIKKEYPSIKARLYKEAFWSQSFCLISTGGANIETIKKYIESQEE